MQSVEVNVPIEVVSKKRPLPDEGSIMNGVHPHPQWKWNSHVLDMRNYLPQEIQIFIDREKNLLKITAEHEELAKDWTLGIREYASQKVTHSLILPEGVRDKDVKARLSIDGLLVLNIPRESGSQNGHLVNGDCLEPPTKKPALECV